MKNLLFTLVFVFSLPLSVTLCGQTPNTFLLRGSHLVEVKENYKKGNPQARTWINALIKLADKDITQKPLSVVTKAKVPPSGNLHDYFSMAPYFWPDSSKPNHLPYINKDGKHNPEIDQINDHKNLLRLVRWVQELSLAYYFTVDEKYAAKAAEFLHVWFLDTATFMNPNLNYAQAILGINDGRASGMIDACDFSILLNAVELLEGSRSWDEQSNKQLKEWFEKYYLWLLESKNGITERKNKNNHGTWYDQQILSVALYLGKKDWAKEYIHTTALARIPQQIEPDGRQPLELARTNALHYSTFALEAWFKTANMADCVGLDIWNYSTADGRSFKKALDWLLPYAINEKKWEYQQIIEFDRYSFYRLLLQASNHYGNSYWKAAQKIKEEGTRNLIAEIFYEKL